jgi:hypothetical protein
MIGNAMFCDTMYCDTMILDPIQCLAMVTMDVHHAMLKCHVIQCNVMPWNSMQCFTMGYNAMF